MWSVQVPPKGWVDSQGDFHSYFPPEVYPSALSYAGPLGQTETGAARFWWAWLGVGLLIGFGGGWYLRHAVRD